MDANDYIYDAVAAIVTASIGLATLWIVSGLLEQMFTR